MFHAIFCVFFSSTQHHFTPHIHIHILTLHYSACSQPSTSIIFCSSSFILLSFSLLPSHTTAFNINSPNSSFCVCVRIIEYCALSTCSSFYFLFGSWFIFIQICFFDAAIFYALIHSRYTLFSFFSSFSDIDDTCLCRCSSLSVVNIIIFLQCTGVYVLWYVLCIHTICCHIKINHIRTAVSSSYETVSYSDHYPIEIFVIFLFFHLFFFLEFRNFSSAFEMHKNVIQWLVFDCFVFCLRQKSYCFLQPESCKMDLNVMCSFFLIFLYQINRNYERKKDSLIHVYVCMLISNTAP